MTDRAATGYFALAVLSLFWFGFVCGVLAQRVAADAPPGPCHEDEALVWLDAPTAAACVPLDSLPVSPETGERK